MNNQTYTDVSILAKRTFAKKLPSHDVWDSVQRPYCYLQWCTFICNGEHLFATMNIYFQWHARYCGASFISTFFLRGNLINCIL
jgi:hypothetical protein